MQLQVSHFVTLILSTGFTVAAPPTLNSNAITAPISGDLISAGKPFTIKWTNVEGSAVTLNLIDGPSNQLKPISQIVANAPNNGAYTWNVPDDLPTSATYAIRISYSNKPDEWNYSDRFTFENQNVVASAAVSSAVSSAVTESAIETDTAVVSVTTEISTATEVMSTASESATESASESVTKSVSMPPYTTSAEETSAAATNTGGKSTTKVIMTSVPTNPAPIDGENSAVRFGGSSSFAGLVVAMAGVIAGGAFIVV
ncbi:hypothetical protein TWF694_006458 [Orbilia ellipsospora]|uniref:Yeast cell wall synthesis Kre9/Knh1-like N-terminal domain-containing protein n=1 Tax=Orbilia ellipsospora TaxID=2528407 RepID=A0AAV9XKK1_9PEZI